MSDHPVVVQFTGPRGPMGPAHPYFVKDRDLSAPPGSPAIGDAYIVGPSPTGAWAGHVNDIATWTGGAIWVFTDARAGLSAWINDEVAHSVYFDGTNWVAGVFQILADRYPIRSISRAAGDGITNDLAALNVARDRGLRLSGEGRIYGVSGHFDLIDDLDLANAKFKQLAPSVSDEVRTIYGSFINRTRLNDIAIDRNGDGTKGTISGGGAAGIYVDGGRDHRWKNLSVTGNDKGNGFRIGLVEDSDFEDLLAHDMAYDDTTILDDILVGLTFRQIRETRIRNFRTRNLFGNPTTLLGNLIGTGTYFSTFAGTLISSATATTVTLSAGSPSAVNDAYKGMQMVCVAGTGVGHANTIVSYNGTTKVATFTYKWDVTLDATSKVMIRSASYTRGLCGDGSYGSTQIISPHVRFTEQGIDITGGVALDGGHRGLQILGSTVEDCLTWGHKISNTQKQIMVVGAQAIRCGRAGFTQGDVTQERIDLFDCVSRDTGYASIWSDSRGFSFGDSAIAGGLRAYNCRAESSIGNMVNGFYSQVGITNPPVLRGCSSSGHTGAELSGAFILNPSTGRGTLSQLAWSVDGDADTGYYSSAANKLAVVTGGGEAVEWTSSLSTQKRNTQFNLLFATSRNTLVLANGLNSNVPALTTTDVLISGPTGAFSLGGIVPTMVDGQHLWAMNNSGQQMTIVNNSGSSTAGNRILTLTGADVVMRAFGFSAFHLRYSGALSAWILQDFN